MHAKSPLKPRLPFKRSMRGFTLIELVIAMVIAVFLVAVALPSFMDSLRKGRRSEAMGGLTALQQEQERWRSNNQAYSESLTDLRITSPTSPGRYYTLAVKSGSGTATGYEAIADGTGSSQAKDGDCAKLAVKVERGNITYASCSTCTTFTYSSTNACWAR